MSRPNHRALALPSNAEAISLMCLDGIALCGHFFKAPSTSPQRQPVLLSPATGVKQTYYFRFAEWLSSEGHDVLVFDYRGIGLSLKGSLKHHQATLAEWGQQDQVTALTWLLSRTQAEKALLLGHSAGGQMIGLLPNHDRVAKVVGISASSGWLRGMRPAFRARAWLGLRVILPIGAMFKGYAPASSVGLGENLPTRVALQWGQWCAAGGYATNAVRHNPELDFHNQVRTPITVLYAEDDDIATPTTVADLLRTYPHAPKQSQRIRPADHGLKSLGHIEWFRAQNQAVWPLIAQALQAEA